MDKRKSNGGRRKGAGRLKLPPEEKKLSVTFQIKKKHVKTATEFITPYLDKLNET